MSNGHKVSSGDYSLKGFFRPGIIRRKLGTLLPFYFPLPSGISAKLWRFAGVRIRNPGKVFVGAGVWLDSAFPERIEIGEHVIIGAGVKILAHSGPTALQDQTEGVTVADTFIGDGVLLGVGSILLPAVRIGNTATVAAGERWELARKIFGEELETFWLEDATFDYAD